MFKCSCGMECPDESVMYLKYTDSSGLHDEEVCAMCYELIATCQDIFSEKVQVTHEMALAADDLSLEGKWIDW